MIKCQITTYDQDLELAWVTGPFDIAAPSVGVWVQRKLAKGYTATSENQVYRISRTGWLDVFTYEEMEQ